MTSGTDPNIILHLERDWARQPSSLLLIPGFGLELFLIGKDEIVFGHRGWEIQFEVFLKLLIRSFKLFDPGLSPSQYSFATLLRFWTLPEAE